MVRMVGMLHFGRRVLSISLTVTALCVATPFSASFATERTGNYVGDSNCLLEQNITCLGMCDGKYRSSRLRVFEDATAEFLASSSWRVVDKSDITFKKTVELTTKELDDLRVSISNASSVRILPFYNCEAFLVDSLSVKAILVRKDSKLKPIILWNCPSGRSANDPPDAVSRLLELTGKLISRIRNDQR